MNIWKIKQDLLNVYDELEENGGELTEELEEALLVTQENFKDKIESYINVIKSVNADVEAIKVEQKRLKDLSDKKQKTVDRLKKIVIEALEEFGDERKSGKNYIKYLDYGTGQVSIRQTKAVEVDTDCVKAIANKIAITMRYARQFNQLEESRVLTSDGIINTVKDSTVKDEELIPGFIINDDDLKHVDVELSVKVPVTSLFDEDGYPILKEMAKYTSAFNVEPAISKTELKKALENNGACAPHVAKLVTNKNISIK